MIGKSINEWTEQVFCFIALFIYVQQMQTLGKYNV